MYAPITSEITLENGMVLREISTGQLFTVAERLKASAEVSGEDVWKISPIDNPQRSAIIMTRQELSEKFFADDK